MHLAPLMYLEIPRSVHVALPQSSTPPDTDPQVETERLQVKVRPALQTLVLKPALKIRHSNSTENFSDSIESAFRTSRAQLKTRLNNQTDVK